MDGVTPVEITGSLGEILSHKCIAHWKEDLKFTRFSCTRDTPNGHLLMVELGDYEEWWCLGYLDEVPDLPEFSPPRAKVQSKIFEPLYKKVALDPVVKKTIEDRINAKVQKDRT